MFETLTLKLTSQSYDILAQELLSEDIVVRAHAARVLLTYGDLQRVSTLFLGAFKAGLATRDLLHSILLVINANTIDFLKEWLVKAEAVSFKMDVAFALSYYGEPVGVEALEKLYEQQDWYSKIELIERLSNTPTDWSRELLERIIFTELNLNLGRKASQALNLAKKPPLSRNDNLKKFVTYDNSYWWQRFKSALHLHRASDLQGTLLVIMDLADLPSYQTSLKDWYNILSETSKDWLKGELIGLFDQENPSKIRNALKVLVTVNEIKALDSILQNLQRPNPYPNLVTQLAEFKEMDKIYDEAFLAELVAQLDQEDPDEVEENAAQGDYYSEEALRAFDDQRLLFARAAMELSPSQTVPIIEMLIQSAIEELGFRFKLLALLGRYGYNSAGSDQLQLFINLLDQTPPYRQPGLFVALAGELTNYPELENILTKQIAFLKGKNYITKQALIDTLTDFEDSRVIEILELILDAFSEIKEHELKLSLTLALVRSDDQAVMPEIKRYLASFLADKGTGFSRSLSFDDIKILKNICLALIGNNDPEVMELLEKILIAEISPTTNGFLLEEALIKTLLNYGYNN